jgi:hypothetical protein
MTDIQEGKVVCGSLAVKFHERIHEALRCLVGCYVYYLLTTHDRVFAALLLEFTGEFAGDLAIVNHATVGCVLAARGQLGRMPSRVGVITAAAHFCGIRGLADYSLSSIKELRRLLVRF